MTLPLKKASSLVIVCAAFNSVAQADTTWVGGGTNANAFYQGYNWTNGLPASSAGSAFTQNALIDTSAYAVGAAIDTTSGAGAINLGAYSLTITNGGTLAMSGGSNVAVSGSTGNLLTVTGSGSKLAWSTNNSTGGFSGVNLVIADSAKVYRVGGFSGGSLDISGGALTMLSGKGLANLTSFEM
ncbi:MAG: hypothetical protein LBV12_04225, partial [Puniceicoccales bacterium]|nr:hypothetical protein [Puniceicoccales bacterium]